MFHYSISYCQTKAKIHTLPHLDVLLKHAQFKIYTSIQLQLLLINSQLLLYILLLFIYSIKCICFFLT
jgi:hypothetical protein